MKVMVMEYVTESFEIDVPDGLEGDELDAAVEEARVQAGPEILRDVEVTSTDYYLDNED